MATYLELTRLTRLLSGIQGTGPSSVVSNQGIEEVLARAVRDAWVDIQNIREEWNFLEGSSSFNTVATQDTYTLLDIFLSSTPDFKKYKLDSLIITNGLGKKSYLQHYDRDVLEAQFLNSTQQELPHKYAVDPSTSSIILKAIPDGVYNVDFRYWKNPEILLTDSQVPSLPIGFHNLIAYKAVEKMAVYLSSPETYRQYATEAAKMMGQLMRLEIPKKRMRALPLV